MNGIGAYGRPFVLVLDDLHTVTSEDCVSSLETALLHPTGGTPKQGGVLRARKRECECGERADSPERV